MANESISECLEKVGALERSKQMFKQDQGNNETISRGVFELHGKFTALTFSESKTFKTRAGAVKWLAKRGYDENGKLL